MKYVLRDLPYQEFEGKVFVVEPREGVLHMFEDTAAFLWHRLRRPASARDLVAALLEEYEVDEPTAARDVEAFLAELREKNLVRVV